MQRLIEQTETLKTKYTLVTCTPYIAAQHAPCRRLTPPSPLPSSPPPSVLLLLLRRQPLPMVHRQRVRRLQSRRSSGVLLRSFPRVPSRGGMPRLARARSTRLMSARQFCPTAGRLVSVSCVLRFAGHSQ